MHAHFLQKNVYRISQESILEPMLISIYVQYALQTPRIQSCVEDNTPFTPQLGLDMVLEKLEICAYIISDALRKNCNFT